MPTFNFKNTGYERDAVPAHRHVNPDGSLGGWVADTAQVSPEVTVTETGRVWGRAIATGGPASEVIISGNLFDQARVNGVFPGDRIHVAGWVYGNAHLMPETPIHIQSGFRVLSGVWFGSPPQAHIGSLYVSATGVYMEVHGFSILGPTQRVSIAFMRERMRSDGAEDDEDTAKTRTFLDLCEKVYDGHGSIYARTAPPSTLFIL